MIATGAGSSTTVIGTASLAYCLIGSVRPIRPDAVRRLVDRIVQGSGAWQSSLFSHPAPRRALPVLALILLLWAAWTLFVHPQWSAASAAMDGFGSPRPAPTRPPKPEPIYGVDGSIHFRRLFQLCAPGIKVNAMAALVKVESHGNPYAIHINHPGTGLARQPASEAQAVATAKRLIRQGYNIDMGLTQINSSNLSWVGLTAETAFDPCNNVRAAAAILHAGIERASKTTRDRKQALLAAYSLYNTGSMIKGYHNGYVRKIMVAARNPFPPD